MLTFYTHGKFEVQFPFLVKGSGEDYITELRKRLTLGPGLEFELKKSFSFLPLKRAVRSGVFTFREPHSLSSAC